jgi:3,4-dihydroxy 2-butanone 4-phosphate synthase/GTP cyclohydrolase II
MHSTVADAVTTVAAGGIVLVVDDPDREDEGDLVMAAEHVTPAAVNLMVTAGRGLVCLPLAAELADALALPPMVPGAAAETAFTVSIDLDVPGSTGISAADRARTIRRAVAPGAMPKQFRRPGHVFPLRAAPGGVLARRGHTEAAVDLARLAGLTPAGVICEILAGDGSMARGPQLIALARRHDLPIISVADLVAHRRRSETLVERIAEAALPTRHGSFRALAYRSAIDGGEHLALVFGRPQGRAAIPVRVHSECLTGDVLGSARCDCGQQLDLALAHVAAAGAGVVVYLRGHEGRGIGLVDKLRAYASALRYARGHPSKVGFLGPAAVTLGACPTPRALNVR